MARPDHACVQLNVEDARFQIEPPLQGSTLVNVIGNKTEFAQRFSSSHVKHLQTSNEVEKTRNMWNLFKYYSTALLLLVFAPCNPDNKSSKMTAIGTSRTISSHFGAALDVTIDY